MTIILLDDVRNLGKRYDVKEVSDGYARNFLFPNLLAEPATSVSMKKLEAMKAAHEKDDKEVRGRLEGIAKKLSETKIEFELKADASGAIFGSVNKESILKALREHRFVSTERVDIDLKHPIKALGEYTVPIDLKRGVTAELKIVVVKEK